MTGTRQSVERFYAVPDILESILEALATMGTDSENLVPSDLAPVDEFHIRGRKATVELADSANIIPGSHILDVGCGLGGSARYLASKFKCHVTGIDLIKEYVEIATVLAKKVGLDKMVIFQPACALRMPFVPHTFDAVWTEHAQMNISDKSGFYSEIGRVLKPGGQLIFHDVFLGIGGEPHYPVPWADDSAISFLSEPTSLRQVIEDTGFRIIDWEDKSQSSLKWFRTAINKYPKKSRPFPLGIHLLLGETCHIKFENIFRNLQEKRIVVIQAVAEKVQN